MSRLVTSGFEIYVQTLPGSGDTTALQEVGAPDGYATGVAATRNTTTKRSGAAALRCNPTAAGAYCAWTISGALDRGYWLRFYVKIASLPTSACAIANITNSFVRMNTSGQIYADPSGSGVTSAALNDGNWHRVEYYAKASATQANRAYELRVDGVTISSGTNQTQDSIVPTNLAVGVLTTTTADLYFDDVAANDDQGAFQNSWPGDGYVILLKPASVVSGGSWTGGAGGALTAAAVNSTPPIGTATETDATQIEANAVATTATFTTITYIAAGATSGDTVIGCQLFVNHGEDIATGTKSGSAATDDSQNNTPLTGTVSFNYGDDLGALGTWPSFWRWAKTPFASYSTQPTLTVGAGVSVSTSTTSRVASCDSLMLYVEMRPAAPTAKSDIIDFSRRQLSRRRVVSRRR